MAKFKKITPSILAENEVLASYLLLADIKSARKGGVFVGNYEVAPDEFRQYGIVLPRGGMIIPDDTPERIRGMVRSKKVSAKRAANEARLAEMQALWTAFCKRNDVKFFIAVYHLQQKLNRYFGFRGLFNSDPVEEIKVLGDKYFSWYSFNQLYPYARGGLADFSRLDGISDMREVTFHSVMFNGKEYPFRMKSIAELTESVEAFIKLHEHDEGVKERLAEYEDCQKSSKERRARKGITIGKGCYFENGDNLVLSSNVTVGNNCYFSTLARVGEGATIGNDVVIVGAMVKPGAVVPDGTVLFQDEIYPPRDALTDRVVEIGDYTEVSEYHRYPGISVVNSPKKASSVFCTGRYKVEVNMCWSLRERGVHVRVLDEKGGVLARKFFEIISGSSAYCLGEHIISEVENCELADDVLHQLTASGVSFPEGLLRAKKSARYVQVEDQKNGFKAYDKWNDNPFEGHFIEGDVDDIDIQVALM